MAAPSNSFDHSGFNAFTHSGFNARGGDAPTPATGAYMCFDPVSGQVKWVWRNSTRAAILKTVDVAGNTYLIETGKKNLYRVNLQGQVDFVVNNASFFDNCQMVGSANGAWLTSPTALAIESNGNVFTPALPGQQVVGGVPLWSEDGATYRFNVNPFFQNPRAPAAKYMIDGTFSVDEVVTIGTSDPSTPVGSNYNTGIYSLSGTKLELLDRDDLFETGSNPFTPMVSSAQRCVETSGAFWVGAVRYNTVGGNPLLDLRNRIYFGNNVNQAFTDGLGNVWVGAIGSSSMILIDVANGNPGWSLSSAAGPWVKRDYNNAMMFSDGGGGVFGSIGSNNSVPVHYDNTGTLDVTYNYKVATPHFMRVAHLFVEITLAAGEDDPVNVLP